MTIMNVEGIADSNLLLLKKAANGEEAAKSLLVEQNTPLVWSIVRRFQNRNHEIEDLFQIGCIGLIKAINKFDPVYEVKFSTYAVPMILGEIKRFLRDDGIIKVSRSLKENSVKIKMARQSLTSELGREPLLTESASRLKMEPNEIVMAIDAGYAPESLDTPLNDADPDSGSIIDFIDSSSGITQREPEVVEKVVDRLVLRQLLGSLKPREKQIIFLRYFKERTQAEIAAQLGVSQVQVSRLEKKIIGEMRKKFEL